MKTAAVISITVAATLAAVLAVVLAQFNVVRNGGTFFLMSDEDKAACKAVGGCSLVSAPMADLIEKMVKSMGEAKQEPTPKMRRSDV